jgi:P-type Ca2+ transporter type 2C
MDGEVRVFVKGAPERILAMCEDGQDKSRLESIALEMAGRGFRVLALAEGKARRGGFARRLRRNRPISRSSDSWG